MEKIGQRASFTSNFLAFTLIAPVLLPLGSAQDNRTLFPCNDEVFCQGNILRTVQMARLFNDSKTFVDSRMSKNPENVLAAFAQLPLNVSRKDLTGFLEENFHPPGKDLEAWIPDDWTEKPAFLGKVVDRRLKQFGYQLNSLWKKLGRKISKEAEQFPNRSSLILVDKPFVVPGGRFREYYYWDTYWTVEGLLACQMNNTVKHMIDNFIQIVKRYGFVPNGGRIYYLNRSQPPFLIPIVDLYLNATEDFDYVKTILKYLEAEYEFWETNRSVQVKISGVKYKLNNYAANMNTPRPESFYEDVHTAFGSEDPAELYRDIASAAESGWDFSTRWFSKSDPESGLKSIRTRRVVPVDLNAILFRNEITLSNFFKRANDSKKSEKYERAAEARRQAMEAVFWREERAMWEDYDLDTNSTINEFYASNVVPLWAGLHKENKTRDIIFVHSLIQMDVFKYPGGVPTSKVDSGQQWDFPNSWAPLQYFIQEGIKNTGIDPLEDIALDLAQKWIKTNYRAWNTTKNMFEKYDARVQGAPGGGGEYGIQVGFGWTNGVALHLLKIYPTQLKAVDDDKPSPISKAESVIGVFTHLWVVASYIVSWLLK